jgi:hypothetical protein
VGGHPEVNNDKKDGWLPTEQKKICGLNSGQSLDLSTVHEGKVTLPCGVAHMALVLCQPLRLRLVTAPCVSITLGLDSCQRLLTPTLPWLIVMTLDYNKRFTEHALSRVYAHNHTFASKKHFEVLNLRALHTHPSNQPLL